MQRFYAAYTAFLNRVELPKVTTIGTGCSTIRLYGLRINAFSNASMPMRVPFTVNRPLGSPERFRG